MSDSDEDRPDPLTLLSAIRLHETREKGGKLKIFFGMSAGVGKTYAMLKEAQDLVKEGVDVAVGVVDTHSRKETEELLVGLEIIPLQSIEYRGTTFKEMDLDGILKRKPKLVLVDELGHSNMVGSRHPKRWQDVMEILDANIDVYTTLNVQHLESRKDYVEGITGVIIRETVPDLVLERAVQIELIDITPTELLKRLREGKVYLGGQSDIAAKNFFQEDRLTALREIALRFTAEKVDHDLHEMMISSKDFGKSWKTTERLMVAVSPSPYSQQLIRTARRIAFNLDAPWIACYVDTGEALSEEERERLSANLDLARDLGAEVISMTDPEVSRTLQRLAKQRNVTQIIIGRPQRGFWKDLFTGGSIIDRLTREKNDIDIHVIRQIPVPGFKKKNQSFSFAPLEITSYWKALVVVLALFVIGHFTSPFVGYKTIGLLYLFCIIGASLFSRKGTVLFIAFFIGLIWYFFIVPSNGHKESLYSDDIILLFLFMFAALITGGLANRLHRNEQLLRSREEKTQALYTIVREIATARSSNQLIEGIKNRLETILKGKCEMILLPPDTEYFRIESSILIDDDKEKAVAYWAFKNGKLAGWSTDILPSVKNLYVPLKSYREVLGLIAFRPEFKRKLEPEGLSLLQTISQHLANYLWRTYVEEKALKSEYLGKIEKIHHSILTSLTLQPTQPMKSEVKKGPVPDRPKIRSPKNVKAMQQIHQSSENLQHLVENLLAMTKLSSGVFSVRKKPENVKELIYSCVDSLNYLFADYYLDIQIGELPLVNMDFSLMELLLCNILINATENSPKGSRIKISATQANRRLLISIFDEGKGIPKEHLEKVFNRFYRVPGSPTPRAGLGLSIAKNIVDVHKGKITAQNRPGGGTEFTIDIPIDDEEKK
jgi:two-component system, OmpR family, sensor histidine kinase KdpD